MAGAISLSDGSVHVILTTRDALDLVGDYMGDEMRQAVLEALELLHADDDACIKALNDRCGELSKNHREVMQKICAAQLILNDLIAAKELDRKAISDICGKLGGIVSTELGRPY